MVGLSLRYSADGKPLLIRELGSHWWQASDEEFGIDTHRLELVAFG